MQQQNNMPSATENADPNVAPAAASSPAGKPPRGGAPPSSKPRGGADKRVSISPKRPTVLSPGSRARRRKSSSHFGAKKKRAPAPDSDDDGEESEEEEESDLEFTLDGADAIEGGEKSTVDGGNSNSNKGAAPQKKGKKAQRRRRSSARFLRLSSGGTPARQGSPGGADENEDEEDDYASSEHLGEIYRQAIRMNAENKINAGNSWGLRLIENMDKFIVDSENGNGDGAANSPRGGEAALGGARGANRSKRGGASSGRVNFTKASCTLDASVKIYSYRVDDVHLSSYRVLANLNRTDNTGGKDGGGADPDGEGGDEVGNEVGGGKAARRRNNGPRAGGDTLETNTGESLRGRSLLEFVS